MCLLVLSEAIAIKSQKHDFSNKNKDYINGDAKVHWEMSTRSQHYIKILRQLRKAGNRRGGLPWKSIMTSPVRNGQP